MKIIMLILFAIIQLTFISCRKSCDAKIFKNHTQNLFFRFIDCGFSTIYLERYELYSNLDSKKFRIDCSTKGDTLFFGNKSIQVPILYNSEIIGQSVIFNYELNNEQFRIVNELVNKQTFENDTVFTILSLLHRKTEIFPYSPDDSKNIFNNSKVPRFTGLMNSKIPCCIFKVSKSKGVTFLLYNNYFLNKGLILQQVIS